MRSKYSSISAVSVIYLFLIQKSYKNKNQLAYNLFVYVIVYNLRTI